MTNWFTQGGKVLTSNGKIRGCCCDDIRTFGLFRGQTIAQFNKYYGYSGMRIYFDWTQFGRWSGSWWSSGAPWFSGNELIADNGGSWGNWPYNQVTSLWIGTRYSTTATYSPGSTVITNVTVEPNVVVLTLPNSAFDSAPVDTVFWSADEPAGTYTSPYGQVCSYPAHTKLFKKIVGPMEPFV